MIYLALVNRAIQESGKDQDDLTSSNFASPPNPRMYNRFKNWVAESYSQLLMARDEWEFRTGRATVNLYPAIYVGNGNRATAPAAGATYQGQDSELEFEIVQTITHSGDWSLGTAAATLYLTDLDGGQFFLGEDFNELSPTPATDIFTAAGQARYNFNTDGQVVDLDSILLDTVLIQPDSTSAELRKLEYVDWDEWTSYEYGSTDIRDCPTHFTIAPDGDYAFYPQPDQMYKIKFNYTTTLGTLSTYDSEPSLIPADFHMLLVWMAVEKSGMYDRDRAIVSRAQKEMRFYRDRLEKAAMPQLNFGKSTL